MNVVGLRQVASGHRVIGTRYQMIARWIRIEIKFYGLKRDRKWMRNGNIKSEKYSVDF